LTIKRQFQEADPWNAESASLRRRNFPHIQVAEATYFVSFRAHIVLPPAARDLVMTEILAASAQSLDLDAGVVMPDHVHLIFRISPEVNLGHVLKLIKGRSARNINQLLKREGSLWIAESFDHIIRREEELAEKVEYVRQNAVAKGLVTQPEDYEWLICKVL
jgi:REP element-mobilizing transposase RayT